MDFDKIFSKGNGSTCKYKGEKLYRIDEIKLKSNDIDIEVAFESTNSDWRQGIVLKTDGFFYVNNQKIKKSIVLWYDSAPKKTVFSIKSKSKILKVYNVWDNGEGSMDYWHNGAAMKINKSNNENRYYCNDGYPDEDFDDLIFTLKKLNLTL